MNDKLRAVGDVIIAKPVSEEKVGGIELPDSVAKDSRVAEVIAVGPGLINEDGILVSKATKLVSVGNRVIHRPYGYESIQRGDEKFIFLRVEDVLAVVE